jgi:hypothetical protein
LWFSFYSAAAAITVTAGGANQENAWQRKLTPFSVNKLRASALLASYQGDT